MAKQSIMHYLAPMHKCLGNCPHVVYFRFQSCVRSCSGSRISTHQEHTMGTQLQTQSNPWQSSPVLRRNSSMNLYHMVIWWLFVSCKTCFGLARSRRHSPLLGDTAAKLIGPKQIHPFCLRAFEKNQGTWWTLRLLDLGVCGLDLWTLTDIGYFCVATESKTFIFRIPEQPQRRSYFVLVETDLIHGEVYVLGDYPTRCTGSFSPFLTVAMWWPCEILVELLPDKTALSTGARKSFRWQLYWYWRIFTCKNSRGFWMFLVKPFVIMLWEFPSCGTVFWQASTGLDIIYVRIVKVPFASWWFMFLVKSILKFDGNVQA